jgi:hypothetical protein
MAIESALPNPLGEQMLEEDIDVVMPEDITSSETEDGGVVVDFSGEAAEEIMDKEDFADNLAEHMDEGDLDSLASELIGDYESDRKSRKDWERSYIEGLDLLGMKYDDRTTPWPGACGVYHPLLAEAVVRYQAQTIMEVMPASGPVRTTIVGKMTTEKAKQAERVEEEMNYIVLQKMPEYRAEMEQLLFRQPLAGSAFKKVYYDPIKKRPRADFVPAEDFVVPYGASDLTTCPRYTHVMKRYPNELRKLMVSGFYRDIDLPDPSPERGDIQDKYDRLDGDSPTWDMDDRHTVLEMHVDFDIPGFEDPDGVALPYVITIEKQAGKVLSIRRNWREDDSMREKRLHFVHYPYLPGLGFYGSGLIHLIGGIAKSTTSIIRQLVDAGTLSNLPAGLKARGLRIKGDSSPLMPGEFRDVDVASGAIKDSITFLPYKEPSAVLYQLLGTLTEEGRRLGSIADVSVGDMNPNAPVGTTLALLERNLKVMSAVQARVHAAMNQEFKLIAGIVRDYMDGGYEYDVDSGFDRTADFDDRVDVIPVSDPNASTMAQRVMQYQAALQMAQNAPQIYNMPLLHREALQVMNIKGADEIVKLPEDMKPLDPVSENMEVLKQGQIRAFVDQDHEAHIAVHMAFMQDPRIQEMVGQSQFAQPIMAAMEAHMAEHLGFAYRQKIEIQMGVNLPKAGEDVPPEVEQVLAQVEAMAAAKVLADGQAEAAQKQAQQNAEDPLIQMQQAEVQIKAQEAQRKAQKDMADAAMKAARLQLDKERLDSSERIAGARIMAEMAANDASLDLKRGSELLNAGINLMEKPENGI